MPLKTNRDKTLDAHVTHMLTLSTAHIDKPTADLLDEEGEANRFPALSVYPKNAGEQYGWFIYVGQDWHNPAVPECLAACLDACNKTGCGLLCLDTDGPIVTNLPTYDW